MRVVVLCEGKTEAALRDGLRQYVNSRSGEAKIRVDTRPLHGTTIRKKIERIVDLHLANPDTLGVIVLSDVYPDFPDASSAKSAILGMVSPAAKQSEKFRPHVAKFDVEAWLIPFWDDICKSLGVDPKKPGAKPEEINGQNPPSMRLKDLYRKAKTCYEKPIDAKKWLTAERIAIAAESCPELMLFLNSLLEFAGSSDRL